MPVAMRTTYQKAEAKYNVTTEFPSLGLHSAAANGNVGLVEYALDHGQPINSVLDGVLPLHAACAGGNVQVVKLLIDHGADVNAPRLPRRYSNDKNRDSSAPIVGTSGSTPLHFAAANGNTEAVTLLLLHGAHANRADKHGITPEMLARQHGWLECADVLKRWLINKDRDLRERPGGAVAEESSGAGPSATTRERVSSFSGDGEPSQTASTRRRIHVKHSIDHALNKLKSSTTDMKLHLQPSSTSVMTSTPPASPTRPFGEYTFHPVLPSDEELLEGGSRRPSLPHIFQSTSGGPSRSRKTSTPTLNNSPSLRRPRSAGTGAEVQEEAAHSTSGRSGVRKLGSKYSLMNLFKKGQTADTGSYVDGSQSSLNVSSAATGSTSALPMPASPNQPCQLSSLLPSTESATSSSIRSGFRFHRGSDSSTRGPSQPSPSPQSVQRKASTTLASPPRPLAVDLHNALAQERQERQTRDRSTSRSGARFSPEDNPNTSPSPGSSPLARLGLLRVQGRTRDRSGSGGSLGTRSSPGHRSGAVFDDDVVVVTGDVSSGDPGKSGARPSILKAHNRTASGGNVPSTPSALRALRFDSSSSGARREGDSEGLKVVPSLRGSNSAGSLGKYRLRSTPEPRLSEEDLTPESAQESGPAAIADFEGPRDSAEEALAEDEDEEEYGQPIHRGESPADPEMLEQPPATLLLRERGLSFASSQSSLSPIMSNDARGPSLIDTDFPFSINKPPAMYPDEEEPAAPAQDLLRVPSPGEGRSRGDSLSSTSTADSRNNPELSASGTTSGSGSGSETINTPCFSSPGREEFLNVATISSPGRHVGSLPIEDVKRAELPEPKVATVDAFTAAPSAPNSRRRHIPPEINLNSISCHAQAEALVQKAQQDIFEMAHSNEWTPVTGSTGRSPLSAKLAAYGETLALEKRLRVQKEQKEKQERKSSGDLPGTQSSSSAEPYPRNGATTPTRTGPRRYGVERQHSLEHRPGKSKSKSRMRDPKRPSTAEGLSPRSVDQVGRFHQASRSASGFGTSPTSRLSLDRDAVSSEEPEAGPILSHSKSATLQTPKRDPSPGPIPRIARSRTPLPDAGEGQLSRISSLECPDTDTELGPPLLRVSTAPHAAVRGGKTASKLTRMGFPPMEQARSSPVPNKRFGGAFKSLVQTLKGKS
ncbi:putative proteasome regulatory particle assembly [Lyophyllum shimeji]|uniref:Proteasome regulatory particle assembly n=1 Tax=Lyophyllum shimeji TaxID=47721 RepID=A0A9P3UK96_LYOSH|nr:putative proteasome regulatory particle assembly [Lyophyllum shimeji]